MFLRLKRPGAGRCSFQRRESPVGARPPATPNSKEKSSCDRPDLGEIRSTSSGCAVGLRLFERLEVKEHSRDKCEKGYKSSPNFS